MIDQRGPNSLLRNLSPRLHEMLPQSLGDVFDDFVEYNEPELAIEQLYDDLVDQELSIPVWLAEELIAVATEYKITRFTPEQVYALVAESRA
jgi:hypothetical protein